MTGHTDSKGKFHPHKNSKGGKIIIPESNWEKAYHQARMNYHEENADHDEWKKAYSWYRNLPLDKEWKGDHKPVSKTSVLGIGSNFFDDNASSTKLILDGYDDDIIEAYKKSHGEKQ